ncbi:MAG: tRNA threonylcarbamoyladenosine dehydratase [Intestinibacter sp.]|uniref:tRNA threonylcarbamoyladenosine dehydratase n=1 Tax=Intestinibacter sp. TaxID=1965304 RepID=UPI002A80AA7A|nr:tRNA threonylcarbamoyladenosine dehydratase [Intestinibacter sp.]MDY4576075.1 tRNA threonylcarbamoyladenosine dehydratase [Intestinibacter sp.]
MEKDFKMRTGLIVGQEGLDKLKNANVIVFGVGGVGSFACEAIVRAGVGNITIVDFDDVDITNINRQIPALHSTVGKFKVDVMKDRLLDINPDLNIKTVKKVYSAETSDEIFTEDYDYVVDAIDMVTSKIKLIEVCNEKGFKIISSMGMGNKLDPTKIVVTDIYKTHTCPLAKVLRRELKNRRIKKLKVVYSTEQPIELKEKIMNGRKVTPGSVSFVPSVGGLVIASVVVRDLLDQE